jgi:hypothetical protein
VGGVHGNPRPVINTAVIVVADDVRWGSLQRSGEAAIRAGLRVALTVLQPGFETLGWAYSGGQL